MLVRREKNKQRFAQQTESQMDFSNLQKSFMKTMNYLRQSH